MNRHAGLPAQGRRSFRPDAKKPADTAGQIYVLWDSFTLSKDGPSKFTERTSELLREGYKDMLWELDPVTEFRLCQMRIFLLDQ